MLRLFRAFPALHPVGASLRLFKIAPGDFVSGGSKTLDERDGAGLGLGALEPRLLDQKCGNEPVDDLQDGDEQLGTATLHHRGSDQYRGLD